MVQDLQSGSLIAWIFVVRPRELPIARSCSPLFTTFAGRCGLIEVVSIDNVKPPCRRERAFQRSPAHVAYGSAIETIVDRRAKTIVGRAISPTRAG